MAKKILTYGVGDLAKISKARRENRFDTIIAMTGKRGSGKSTLGWKIAKKIGGFRPEKNTIYDLDSLKKALEGWDKTLLLDEAIYVTYKRDWQKQGQKELVKQLNAYRDHRNVLIMCIPNFWDLDKPLRDMTFARIDITRRGRGVVHIPIPSSYTQDYWDSDNNQKKEKQFILGQKIPRYHKLSTFSGYINFTALPTREETRYQKIKNEKRNDLYETEKKNDPVNNIHINLLNRIKEGEINRENLRKICLVNGWKYSTIQTKLNMLLRDEGSKTTLRKLIVSPNKPVENKIRIRF